VLILLAIQVFLEVIVLSLGRKIPMISSSSALKGSSSSYKRTLLSSKRKSIVEKRGVVKHTKQMSLPKTNLPIMMNIKLLVLLLLQAWLLLFLLSIFSFLSLNCKLEHLSLLIDSLSNVLPKLAQFVLNLYIYRRKH